jgi:transcriptional regulator with PAS, ATPase and Fis domain
MVSENAFRQDLLYRINTIEIHLPPLRDRNEDIDLLADHFLKQYKKKYKKKDLKLSDKALAHLKSYHWPGNIRELEHAVERAVILSDEDVLSPGDFLLTSGTGASHEIPVDDLNLEEIEKAVIQKALDKHQGNISRAAEDLGLTRTSLYRRMEKYEL